MEFCPGAHERQGGDRLGRDWSSSGQAVKEERFEKAFVVRMFEEKPRIIC